MKMMKNVQKQLLKILKSDEADAAITVGITTVSAVNPLAGILLTASQQIGNLADEIRIDAVIKGLATDLNQEEQINRLYEYAKKNEKNAFYVINTLRKALLADSLIACTIMGRILASHVSDNSKYDYDDNIIFHALQNATDDDIRQFYKVMREYKSDDEEGNCVFHIPIELIRETGLSSSLEWCVFNRIFTGTNGILWGKIGQDFDDSHSPTSAGFKLMDYVESVRQVLEYEE